MSVAVAIDGCRGSVSTVENRSRRGRGHGAAVERGSVDELSFGSRVLEQLRTADGANDDGKKLPASMSLLLHILDGIGVDAVRVATTDARHALIAGAAAALTFPRRTGPKKS